MPALDLVASGSPIVAGGTAYLAPLDVGTPGQRVLLHLSTTSRILTLIDGTHESCDRPDGRLDAEQLSGLLIRQPVLIGVQLVLHGSQTADTQTYALS